VNFLSFSIFNKILTSPVADREGGQSTPSICDPGRCPCPLFPPLDARVRCIPPFPFPTRRGFGILRFAFTQFPESNDNVDWPPVRPKRSVRGRARSVSESRILRVISRARASLDTEKREVGEQRDQFCRWYRVIPGSFPERRYTPIIKLCDHRALLSDNRYNYRQLSNAYRYYYRYYY